MGERRWWKGLEMGRGDGKESGPRMERATREGCCCNICANYTVLMEE